MHTDKSVSEMFTGVANINICSIAIDNQYVQQYVHTQVSLFMGMYNYTTTCMDKCTYTCKSKDKTEKHTVN